MFLTLVLLGLSFQQPPQPVFADGLSDSSKIQVLSSRLDILEGKISKLKKSKACKAFDEYQTAWVLTLNALAEVTNFRLLHMQPIDENMDTQVGALEKRVMNSLKQLLSLDRKHFRAGKCGVPIAWSLKNAQAFGPARSLFYNLFNSFTLQELRRMTTSSSAPLDQTM